MVDLKESPLIEEDLTCDHALEEKVVELCRNSLADTKYRIRLK